MRQAHGKETVMKDILKRLKPFSPKMRRGYIDITLPVVIYTDGGLLDLRIRKTESGYKITCPRDLFAEANRDGAFYFSAFERYGAGCHYGVKIKNGRFCKEYDGEQSIVVAINELIRFFILLDDFILANDVIGNEENFV